MQPIAKADYIRNNVYYDYVISELYTLFEWMDAIDFNDCAIAFKQQNKNIHS